MRSILLFLFSLLLVASCVHDPFPPSPESICDAGGVDYKNEVLPILIANCGMSGCHGNGSSSDGLSVESYSSVLNQIEPFDLGDSELWEVINETDPSDVMPPPPREPLNSQEKDLIRRWIMEGAQETDCGRDNCQGVMTPSFNSDILPIAQSYCAGSCHFGSNPSGGFTLETKADWESALDNRGLLDALLGQNGRSQMPPLPSTLDTCYINNVIRWDQTGRSD